jgi:hypothetical protein
MILAGVLTAFCATASANELILRDALSPDESVVTRNCTTFQRLSTLNEGDPNSDDIHSAKTNIEVWCNPGTTSRLTQDLASATSRRLFYAINTWSAAFIMGNVNGKANLAMVQDWYIRHCNEKWAQTPQDRHGYKIAPLTIIETALIGKGEISPIIESDSVPESAKRSLQKKMKELNDLRGSLFSTNGAAGR